ncbi:phosphatase PAP2 family protein [Brevundimonas aurantiaca]|jgi:undecaprenyl-diphosphatase|uniref:phosphatase PAP2 family protein n=1 Tax=Brevundimonas aurantiaca TaxID=74316 RepID=UPI001604610A|nr:PAP2 family protein [Pseudomonas sp. FW305-3-2-15-E-TSA4]
MRLPLTLIQRARDCLTVAAISVFLAVSAGLWFFLTLAGEMREGETRALDEKLLLLLRTPGNPDNPLGPRWVEEAMRDVTALGGFTVLTLVAVIGVIALARTRRWRAAVVLAGVALGAELTSDLLKLAYARPRPDLTAQGSYVYTHSFPSGHSTVSTAIYFTLAALLASAVARHGSRALILVTTAFLVLAIGVSRVYLGVHWPTDVVAGWAVGSIWAVAGWRLLRSADPPRRPEDALHNQAAPRAPTRATPTEGRR